MEGKFFEDVPGRLKNQSLSPSNPSIPEREVSLCLKSRDDVCDVQNPHIVHFPDQSPHRDVPTGVDAQERIDEILWGCSKLVIEQGLELRQPSI